MANGHAKPLGPNGECDQCNGRHWRDGKPTCRGHVRYDRESYVKGQDRKPLPEQRPCRLFPKAGLPTCIRHGAASEQAAAAGQRREVERRVLAMIGDAGEPVTDPIGKLCAIAGRAVAFMEALAARVSELEDAAGDEARAEIAVYGRSIKDAAAVVESIIRMGIAERLAKAEESQTAAIVAFIDSVLTDLGHNPRDPEVAGVVARRLELVS